MLRITIELVPFGVEDEAHKIATMLIANDGTGTHKTGNYAYAYEYADRPDDPEIGIITRFPRNDGAWELVRKVLNNKYHSNGNELTDLLLARLEQYAIEDLEAENANS